MAKITRIKAKDPGKGSESASDTPKRVTKVKALKDQAAAETVFEKAEKMTKQVEKGLNKDAALKTAKKAEKSIKAEKNGKKPFILIRPFVYFGRYIRDSWREIRQVRWPSRRATWKLFLAIVIYTLLFVAVIMLLDAIFTWLFETVIG